MVADGEARGLIEFVLLIPDNGDHFVINPFVTADNFTEEPRQMFVSAFVDKVRQLVLIKSSMPMTGHWEYTFMEQKIVKKRIDRNKKTFNFFFKNFSFNFIYVS